MNNQENPNIDITKTINPSDIADIEPNSESSKNETTSNPQMIDETATVDKNSATDKPVVQADIDTTENQSDAHEKMQSKQMQNPESDTVKDPDTSLDKSDLDKDSNNKDRKNEDSDKQSLDVPMTVSVQIKSDKPTKKDKPPAESQPEQKNTQQKTSLTICMAQASFLVGAIENNCDKMVDLANQAKKDGADVIVFPELAILGYPPEDLLQKQNLNQRVQNAFKKLYTVKDILMIVGYPHVDHHGIFNSCAIIHNGKKRGFYHKQHLPNYGVFDEKRYFTAGKNNVSFDFKGHKIGLLICEDLWQPEPIQALKTANVDLVISLNASPFETEKQTTRKSVIASRVKETGLPIMYVNTVGGQDDLVFDGGSMAVDADGTINVEYNRFIETSAVIGFSKQTKTFVGIDKPLTLSADAQNYYALVIGLRDYVKHSGFKNVLLGLSGGIDSALTLCIVVDALGADNVYAVMMPYEYTAKISLEDAQKQAERLGVSYTVAPIHHAYQGMMQTLAPLFGDAKADTTEENLQARIRGMILMALSNKFGQMLITTGNKSEIAVGYATLYGDMCGGFSAIKDIYKTDVYALAKYRNQVDDKPVIPERVITRPPSAELRPDQTDQDSLPDYDVLDKILRLYIDEQQGVHYIIKQGFNPDVVKKVVKLVDRNEYKRRQGAPGVKIGKRAFNRERRYPIVNGWLKGL